MADSPAQPRRHVYFRIREPGSADRILIVDTQELTIGRSQEADLNAKYADVSRRHALIQREAQKFSVHNLSNSSSTLVNGRAVTSHVLQSQDAIRIGELEITYVESADNPAKLGPRLEYASQLKNFAPAASCGGNPEATILGVAAAGGGADGGFAVGRAGDFAYGLDADDDAASAPRDLDLELDGFGLHDDREPVELTPEALAPAARSDSRSAAKAAAAQAAAQPAAKAAAAPTHAQPTAKSPSAPAAAKAPTAPAVAKASTAPTHAQPAANASTAPSPAKTTAKAPAAPLAATSAPKPAARNAPPREAPREASSDVWTLEEPLRVEPTAREGALSVSLEIEGLTPELRQLVGSLLGKIISLPTLTIRIKGADLD